MEVYDALVVKADEARGKAISECIDLLEQGRGISPVAMNDAFNYYINKLYDLKAGETKDYSSAKCGGIHVHWYDPKHGPYRCAKCGEVLRAAKPGEFSICELESKNLIAGLHRVYDDPPITRSDIEQIVQEKLDSLFFVPDGVGGMKHAFSGVPFVSENHGAYVMTCEYGRDPSIGEGFQLEINGEIYIARQPVRVSVDQYTVQWVKRDRT